MGQIKLSIVIPVYNSQDTIETVVHSLIHLYNKIFLLEIILVNDGSRDKSLEKCEELGNQYANVIVIHQEKNSGQQQALMTGLRQCQGDLVVLMDDDMQNPPSEVIKLIYKINEGKGYDVVIGQRIIYNQTWFRKFVSNLNQLIMSLSMKQKISFSNFLIMKRSMVIKITMDQSSKPIIQGLILKSKANIANALTEHHEGGSRKSNYNLIKLFKFWLTTIRYLPLYVKYILFLLMLIVGVSIMFVINYLIRL